MVLDEIGIRQLDTWFRSAFDCTTEPAKLDGQKKGIDIAVKLLDEAGAKYVGIDLKADNTTTGNISLELISQDRPNSRHAEPVVGWTGKEMPIVAQLFVQTGEMVVLNMKLFYPWLLAQLKEVVAGKRTAFLPEGAWLSATPNATYLSYNIIVRITTLLDEAPGCLYLRPRDRLQSEAHRNVLPDGAYPKPVMLTGRSYDEAQALAVLRTWLKSIGGYDRKEQLDAQGKERLLRFMEPRVRFSTARPEIRQKGLELQRSRPKLALPGDAG